MNSSAKFLVPTVIVGFGPDAVVVGAVLLLPPPPPQAVRPIRSATPKEIANAALAARRVCLRNMVPSSLGLPSSGTLRPWSHPTRGSALGQADHPGSEEREGRDTQ